MKQKKEQQIHLRVTEAERQKIINAAKLKGYNNTSKFIIDSTLDAITNSGKKDFAIHTISLSATLDYRIDINNFNPESKNQFTSSDREFLIGGRGINTSLILKELNVDSTAVHYSGGFTGSYIWDVLESKGIGQYRIKSQSPTRINLNVFTGNEFFTLEEKANSISEYGKENLIDYIHSSVHKNDIVVVSGSYYDGDKKFISKLLKNLTSVKARIIVNFPNVDLLETIKGIKPELVVLDHNNSSTKLKTQAKIVELLESYIDDGIKSVAYIEDVNFTFFKDKDYTYKIETNKSDQRSVVGLRDAFIAGYIHNEEYELEERIQWGAASQKAKSIESRDVSYKNILEAKEEVICTKI